MSRPRTHLSHVLLVVSSSPTCYSFLTYIHHQLRAPFRQLNHMTTYPFNMSVTYHVYHPSHDRSVLSSSSNLFRTYLDSSSVTWILQATQPHHNISPQNSWDLSCFIIHQMTCMLCLSCLFIPYTHIHCLDNSTTCSFVFHFTCSFPFSHLLLSRLIAFYDSVNMRRG